MIGRFQVFRWMDHGIRIFLCGILLFLVVAAFINLQYGIEDVSMMKVFSMDEPLAVEEVLHNLKHNDLNPRGFYSYGYVYHTIVFFLAKFFHWFNYTVNETRFVAFIFRLVSLTSYIFLLWFVYLFLRNLFKVDPTIALCAIVTLGSIPNLYYWGQLIHPDIPQAFLITLAAYLAFYRHKFHFALLAAIIGGIAFGTKYSGIFILPFLGIPAAIDFVRTHRTISGQITLKNKFLLLLIAAGIIVLFIGAWLISNPYVVRQFHDFYSSFVFEQLHVARGHGKAEPTNPLLWFILLYQGIPAWSGLLIVLGILAEIFVVVRNMKTGTAFLRSSENVNACVIILYICAAFGYLMIAVNMRELRFLFHILPFMVILGFSGLNHISRRLPTIAGHVMMLVLAGLLLPGVAKAVQDMAWCSARYKHPYIQATIWIENRFSPDVRILADHYSYRSPKFTNYKAVWRVDAEVAQFQPQVIILNKSLSGRWSWKKNGTKFADGKWDIGDCDDAQTVHQFHLKLFASSSYQVVYEDADVVVLHHVGGEDKNG